MIQQLNELSDEWELVDLRFDFKRHVLEWRVAISPNNTWLLGDREMVITCDHVLVISYGTALDDVPPWQFSRASAEEIPPGNMMQELQKLEFICTDVAPFEEKGPYYRLTVRGWEFNAVVICKQIVVAETKRGGSQIR